MSRPERFKLIAGGNQESFQILPRIRPSLYLVPPAPEKSNENRWHRRTKAAGIVGAWAVALSCVGIGGSHEIWWKRLDASGEIVQIQPSVEDLSKSQRLLDNEIVVITYNLHQEAYSRPYELLLLAERESADAIGAQEITSKDEASLAWLAKNGLYTTVAKADSRHKLGTKWQGNALITRQEPQNPTAKAIRGFSYFKTIGGIVDGLITDVARAETSFTNTKKGSQEDRVAQAVTIQAMNGDRKIDVRVINTHISSKSDVGYIVGADNVHKHQRDELGKIIEAELKKEMPIILMGDFNELEEDFVPWASSLGFTVAVTGPTSTNGMQRLDYIAYHPAALGKSLVLEDVEVLGEATDHHAVRAIFTLPKPEKISLKYKRSLNQHQQYRNELKLHSR